MNDASILRRFTIECRANGEFWLKGAPRNWKPGDAWLVAHDVFHHFEGEPGTVEREVMSFGVEHWLEQGEQDLAQVASTLAGALADDFSDGISARLLARLFVPEVPDVPDLSEALPEEVSEFLRSACTIGMYELLESLEQYHAYEFTPDQRDALLSDRNLERHANWAMLGYLKSQRRYPEAPAFQRAFQRLQSCVRNMVPGEWARLCLATDARLVAENRVAARAMLNLHDSAVLLEAGHLVIRPRLVARSC